MSKKLENVQKVHIVENEQLGSMVKSIIEADEDLPFDEETVTWSRSSVAFESAEYSPNDLFIIDLYMPGKGGLLLIEELMGQGVNPMI